MILSRILKPAYRQAGTDRMDTTDEADKIL
jgi:hypothetical protein